MNVNVMVRGEQIELTFKECSVCASKLSRSEEHTKAWEYLKTSEWTSGQLAIWVELTGKLPPDDMKEYPREALQTLDMAVHFSPEHIEAIKQRVLDMLGD